MEKNLNNTDLRAYQLIVKSINQLKLDLTGKTILTEIGSNNYLYTPLIALIAGASKVIAYTKNTLFLDANEVALKAKLFKEHFDIQGELEFRIDTINYDDFKIADVITNSGFLRPLNESCLQYTKNGVVIPVMYEAWEIRKEDVDVEYCKKSNIKLAGTWENHPDIKVFSGIGPLSVKLAQEAGYEVYQNNIIVWSDDHFGEEAEKCFLSFGAENVIVTNDVEVLYKNVGNADFIFICDYDEKRDYFGNNAFLDLNKMLQINPSIGVVHLYGNIDYRHLCENGVNVYPKIDGHAMKMTKTLGYLGLIPIINLQVAGFKVAECLITGEKNSLVQLI